MLLGESVLLARPHAHAHVLEFAYALIRMHSSRDSMCLGVCDVVIFMCLGVCDAAILLLGLCLTASSSVCASCHIMMHRSVCESARFARPLPRESLCLAKPLANVFELALYIVCASIGAHMYAAALSCVLVFVSLCALLCLATSW